MKILWNLQLSAIDKNTKTFLIEKDSTFSICENVIKAFYNKHYDFSHVILLPSNSYQVSPLPNSIFETSSNYITSVFSSRYQWDINCFSKILLKHHPDIIWENNPSLVNNWKTLLYELNMLDKCKIITYNSWIDSDKFPKIDRRCPYAIRQFEGAMLSDLCLCNSNEAKQQIIKHTAADFFSPQTIEKYQSKIQICAPFVEEKDILKHETTKPKDHVAIVYNHRLSSLPYYADGYNIFCKLINNISNRVFKLPIKIYFTDVSGKLTTVTDIPIEKSKNIEIILAKNLTKEDYYKLLWQTHICAALFKEENGGAWSISLADGILTKNAILVPNHSGYKEMVDPNFKWLINTFDIESLSNTLYNLIENEELRHINSTQAFTYFLNNFSSDVLSSKLFNLIKAFK